MRANRSIVRIALVGIIALLLGWSLILAVGTRPTQADTGLPPLVAHMPADITSKTIPTPTLPSRLKLVAPAFTLAATRQPLTLTVDTTGFADDISRLHLVYQADPQAKWRLVYAAHNNTHGVQIITIPGTGTYAWVWLTPAAAPPPPTGALVVDDVAPGFVTHTHSTPQYWHIATTGGDYYGGHTHWTRNTQTVTTTENWATWQPTTPLTGPYAVWVYVPNDYADTEHARYVVSHAGISTTVEIDQNAIYPDAAWVCLGAFHFISDTASYVLLTDTTAEPYDSHWIAFDAVAFVPQTIYLPLVMRNWPTPPPQKQRSGIHLGNRSDDWRPPGAPADFLSLLDPEVNEDGIYPAAVVILSSYLYNIERSSITPCNIEHATVRVPSLYAYLQRASQNGTQVIIRIHPSPGNFSDWDIVTKTNHLLNADITPAGEHYCWSDSWPESPDMPYGFQYFRAYADIADEMGAIHTFNAANGWSEAGFIPANEPNTEWYSFDTVPKINWATTWQAMNAYFVALYDYAHLHYPGVNVFTPAMAQTAFGETRYIQTCDPMNVDNKPGYTWMEETYKNKNDGYTWNNYYWYGQEPWDDCPNGQHVSYFFPLWLQGELDFYTTKPRFIIETDLAAPQQMSGGSSLMDKDADASLTTTSLQRFTQAEQRADVVIFWLLTNANNSDEEFNWHKAYNSNFARK